MLIERRKLFTANCAVLVVVLSVATQLTGCSDPADPGNANPIVNVVSAEDVGVVSQDGRLTGRDGGYSGMVGNRQVWVFGDSVITEPNAAGNTWLGSSYSFNNDFATDVADVSLPLASDQAGLPVELFDYSDTELEYIRLHRGENCLSPCGSRWALWPGPVVSDPDRNRSLVFYTKVHASPGEFNFYGVGQSIAVWPAGAARPARVSYQVVPDYPSMMFSADEPQFGSGAFAENRMLYVFACDRVGAVKPCRLARAPLATAINKNTWEYFGAGGVWGDAADDLSALFHGNDIMSASYNEYLNAYTLVYSEPLSRTIYMRTAVQPEGPWSRPVKVASAMPSVNGNGWVYDGLAHAEMNQQGGQVIFVTYTRDTGTSREMRLVRVELSRIE